MWFQTVKIKNKETDRKITFIPTRVLQIWDCKKCHNVILQRKYPFSPFNKENEKQTNNLCLENVIIKVTNCSEQKFMKIGYRNRQFQVTNQVKIFCKVCEDNIVLGQFKPQVDLAKVQFHYALIPYFQNIKKTKIIYGKNNRNQVLQQNYNFTELQRHNRVGGLQKLRMLQKQIQRYILLWYHSRNFQIYQSFKLDSCTKKYNMECMRKFMIKMKPNGNKVYRKDQRRFKIKQNSIQNSYQSEFTL